MIGDIQKVLMDCLAKKMFRIWANGANVVI